MTEDLIIENAAIENTVVELSETDWLQLNSNFSDVLLKLEHFQYESPAFFNSEGVSYLSLLSEDTSQTTSLSPEVGEMILTELAATNSYLYTLNVYMAGFLVIVLIMLLIKSFNGFMSIFLNNN